MQISYLVFDLYRRSLIIALATAIIDLPTAVFGQTSLVRVEAVTPRQESSSPDLFLTGQIAARIQSEISFRINGKVTARRVEVGQHVAADQVLAKLDPAELQADVANDRAALRSAEAQLRQATVDFGRQRHLITTGFTTRVSYDQAKETLAVSAAEVKAAQATLDTANEQLSYTELKAEHAGIIVARMVEAGQVVQAGQSMVTLAEDASRDAVFEVPEALLTKPPENGTVEIRLQSDPAVTATGMVREISPILDASTGTVTVKISLTENPPRMTLGAAIVGHAHWQAAPIYTVPWSALFESSGHPALWVLDDQDRVSLRAVSVRGYRTGSVMLDSGLDDGQRVVTAGIQLLYPGQKVAVVEGVAP